MIGSAVKHLLLENEENLLIDEKNVATLTDTNTLEHALLVLTNIGYSRIPVLNKEGKLVGLISLSQVVAKMFDTESFNTDNLSHLLVKDCMDTDTKAIQKPFNIERILHLLVDANFIPVVDEDGIFQGIVTRKGILKSVNFLAHELEMRYDVTEKDWESSEHLANLKIIEK